MSPRPPRSSLTTPHLPREPLTMTSKRRTDPLIEATVHRFEAARSIAPACLIVLLGGTLLRAEDWPTNRHDAARSGATSEEVPVPLQESWVFHARHLPPPARGDPLDTDLRRANSPGPHGRRRTRLLRIGRRLRLLPGRQGRLARLEIPRGARGTA